MRVPVPGSLWSDAGGRRYVAVVIDSAAGGGMAFVKLDPFDPARPEMIAAWSHRVEGLQPIPAVPARMVTPGHEACDLDRVCSGGPYRCLQDPAWGDATRVTPALPYRQGDPR